MAPRHFLDLADWTSHELLDILELARQLKREWQSGGNRPVLGGYVLAMVFQKPSLRTRMSFEIAMKHLGGDAIYISPAEVGLGTREAVPDVARVLSGYVQGIMARTFAHDHILQLAAASSIPVINGLTDYNHPAQALADMLTIYEHFGTLKGLKLAYIGDGNNVAVSLLMACALLGLDFSIAAPPGYEIPAPTLVKAAPLAEATGITIETHSDPQVAVGDANILYTDAWFSMGQEAEAEKRRPLFQGFQINADLMAAAAPDAVAMHCLPAHRGEEITDDAADGPRSLLFPQAANRLHAQKALLVRLLSPHQLH